MLWRLVLPLLLAATLIAHSAMAGLVALPTEKASAVEAKVALAITEARTTRWLSLRMNHPATALMWIVPVRPAAFADTVPFTFFEALEDVTSPRVIPPHSPAPCGFTPSGPEANGDMSAHPSHEPVDMRHLESVTDALLHAERFGMALPEGMTPQLEALSAQGFQFLALTYVSLAKDEWLSPLRIVDDAPPVLPFLLSRADEEVTKLTAFVIGNGRASLDTKLSLELDRAKVRFGKSGRSNYAKLRDEFLTSLGGGAFIIESTGHDFVFSATPLPRATRPLPSLVDAYLSRATGSSDTCVTRIAALANRDERVALACPEGMLTRPEAGCAEGTRPGEIGSETLRCGVAAELAFAFSGQRPSEITVTRAIGILPAKEWGEDLPVSVAEGEPLSPLVVTMAYAACESEGGEGGAGHSPGGGESPSPWTPPPLAGEEEASDLEPDDSSAWVAAGCAAIFSSWEYEDDSGSEESCSSGTGGSSDWDDEGDESCDSEGYGGSEGEDEYDSCDGGTEGYEESDEECSVARRRKRLFRPKLSAYTLVLAAMALPIRRLTRPYGQREP